MRSSVPLLVVNLVLSVVALIWLAWMTVEPPGSVGDAVSWSRPAAEEHADTVDARLAGVEVAIDDADLDAVESDLSDLDARVAELEGSSEGEDLATTLDDLQSSVDDLDSRVNDVEAQVGTTDAETEIADLETRLGELESDVSALCNGINPRFDYTLFCP